MVNSLNTKQLKYLKESPYTVRFTKHSYTLTMRFCNDLIADSVKLQVKCNSRVNKLTRLSEHAFIFKHSQKSSFYLTVDALHCSDDKRFIDAVYTYITDILCLADVQFNLVDINYKIIELLNRGTAEFNKFNGIKRVDKRYANFSRS